MKISTDDLTNTISQIVAKYGEEVNECVNEAVESASVSAVAELKETSPKDTSRYAKASGAYAKGWKYEKTITNRRAGRFGSVVWNPKHYRLTHLLEFGHDLINKNGDKYGHADAKPHIAKVEQNAIRKFEEEIKRRLNGIK